MLTRLKKMLTTTSESENCTFPPIAASGAQEFRRQASPERWREFDDILSHAIPHFRQIAMCRLGNREDAEDAVQDAMLSAFRHIAQFDGRAKMSTWLTAIVLNAVRMQIRARPRARMMSLDSTTAEGKPTISELLLVDTRPNPEKTLEQSELRKILTRLTGGLPLPQKAAVRLRHQHDFSIREAAKTLKVPEGTLKAQLARGRAKLAEQFQHVIGKPKSRTSGFASRAKRRASSSAYRRDRTQLAELRIAVLAQQEGGEGWAQI
jgi:RNA polymerase sigma-70 factor, ECF subfamily